MENIDFKKIKKLEKQLKAAILLFIIIITAGAWIVFGLVSSQSVLALGLTGNYNKLSGDQLTINDWNNLDDDFVDAGGDTIAGPLIINNKVGIGTTNPISSLNVEKAGILASADKNWIMDVSQRMNTDSAGGLLGIRIGFGGDGVYDGRPHTDRSVGIAAVAEDTWGNDVGMALYTGGANENEWSEKVRITHDGKVGIGTDNPSIYNLAVRGQTRLSSSVGQLRLTNTDDWKNIDFTVNSGGNLDIEGGNVGIGIANPQVKLEVDGDIKTSGSIKYNTLSDWRLVYRDDFEFGNGGWGGTTTGTSVCGGTNKIMGGYNMLSSGNLTKTYNLQSIPHTNVKVVLEYYSIDSWDNEWAIVYVTGSGVNRYWNQQAHFDNTGRAQACGAAYKDGVFHVELSGTHPGNLVEVVATSNLGSGASDESFGVDNVEVWVR